jgi:hypothetical protein
MTKFKSYGRLLLLLTGFHFLATVLAFFGSALCFTHEIGPKPIGDIFAFIFWVLLFPSALLMERLNLGLSITPVNSLLFGVIVAGIILFIRSLRKSVQPSVACDAETRAHEP